MASSTLPVTSHVRLSNRSEAVSESLIGQLSRLAEKYGALNLSEGFPNYPAPSFLKEAACAAIHRNHNQYSYRSELCKIIAENFSFMTGMTIDSTKEVALTCGQSGAFSSAVLAVINPGDEVLILDPAYETYGACVIAAGGIPKYVRLQPPNWEITKPILESAIKPETRAIIINSPTNPTGRVLSLAELSVVADVCTSRDVIAITDEVYEHFVYSGKVHTSLSSLPGMRERTIVTSSISKTFSVTGWRIGWAIAPEEVTNAIAKLHCKFVDSPPSPFQEASLSALNCHPEYYENLRKEYEEKRALICEALESGGLIVPKIPEGGVFVFALIPPEFELSDVDFARILIQKGGIAVVPGSNFFHTNSGCGTNSSKNGQKDGEKTESVEQVLLGDETIDGFFSENGQTTHDFGKDSILLSNEMSFKYLLGGNENNDNCKYAINNNDKNKNNNHSNNIGNGSNKNNNINRNSINRIYTNDNDNIEDGASVFFENGKSYSDKNEQVETNGNKNDTFLPNFDYSERYIRVAFCKSKETLVEASKAFKLFKDSYNSGNC